MSFGAMGVSWPLWLTVPTAIEAGGATVFPALCFLAWLSESRNTFQEQEFLAFCMRIRSLVCGYLVTEHLDCCSCALPSIPLQHVQNTAWEHECIPSRLSWNLLFVGFSVETETDSFYRRSFPLDWMLWSREWPTLIVVAHGPDFWFLSLVNERLWQDILYQEINTLRKYWNVHFYL